MHRHKHSRKLKTNNLFEDGLEWTWLSLIRLDGCLVQNISLVKLLMALIFSIHTSIEKKKKGP